MLENPLIRFLGSAIALANLPAIEIFGSIEQRPSPAIFMVMLVTRVDEILGYDVSRHFQSGEITVKLASHSLDLRSSSFLQGRVEASFTLLLLRASVFRETAGCPKSSRGETAGRLKRAENGSFYRVIIWARELASHSLDLRSSSFLQGRVEASFTLLLLRASVFRETAGCPKFSRDETACRLKRAENGSFY